MQEFNYIEKYFKPLVSYKGGLQLKDDVCFINCKDFSKLVINCDTIVEGTHFFSEDSPQSVANKALVSNISDLYAKGLKPLYYTLAISFNKKTFNENYLKQFTNKLLDLQQFYNVSLIGGDTTLNSSKLCITINIFSLTNGNLPLRENAKAENDIYLTRNIGDSYLGYLVFKGKLKNINNEDKEYFKDKYLNIGLDSFNFIESVSPYLVSSLDISDGLLADLNHICKQSKLGALINFNELPFSVNFAKYIPTNNKSVFKYCSFGGDYNLLFTANKTHRETIKNIAKQTNTKLSLIGKTTKRQGIYTNINAKECLLNSKGYNHFA